MRVIVAGNYKKPILLDTDEATALLIETNDGKPSVLFKLLSDGNGFLRLTRGEDKNFDEVARQYGLI